MTARARSGRGPVVLAAAVVAIAVLAVSTRPWVAANVADALGGDGNVAVPGSSAAPVVPALALVGFASAGALTIARRVGRAAALVAMAVAGIGAAAAAGWVLADPSRAARPAIAEATGLTARSVGDGTATVTLTAWPVLAAALAVMLTVVAVRGWTARRRWETSPRFEAAEQAGSNRGAAGGKSTAGDDGHARADAADAWDALSRGDDPTGERG